MRSTNSKKSDARMNFQKIRARFHASSIKYIFLSRKLTPSINNCEKKFVTTLNTRQIVEREEHARRKMKGRNPLINRFFFPPSFPLINAAAAGNRERSWPFESRTRPRFTFLSLFSPRACAQTPYRSSASWPFFFFLGGGGLFRRGGSFSD